MGLTLGSVHWPMSRASSHATAVGLRLSRERRARPGHVSVPDRCSRRGPLRLGTSLRCGPYLGGPGVLPRDPSCLLGSPRLVCTEGLVPYGGGPDSMMHPAVYHLSSPRGALRPAHVVGSGATLRVTWRGRTGAAPSCCRRGYP
jgi:hypothetical protein